MSDLDVVTGAFSYTGRRIAEQLLGRGRRVRTLTRRPDPTHPLTPRVEVAALVFDDTLVESLRGADTLYTTYLVRFERGLAMFDAAVSNLALLLDAAARAGIRRIVHVSVANPGEGSPFPYFRGKARAEALVRASGLSYAIVRPTLVFGPDDILVNDIAWILRRLPLFLVPGDGCYAVQPVSVGDTARICIEAGAEPGDVIVDAAGPERFSFEPFVRLRAAAGREQDTHLHSARSRCLADARPGLARRRAHAGRGQGAQPGSTVLRDREALVGVVRTCGGVVQAGDLHDSFPARSASSGWQARQGRTGSTRTGSGLAGLRYGDATPAQNGGSRLRAGLLVSHEPPLGRDRFGDWLSVNGAMLGRSYRSELRRNFSGRF